MFTVINTYLSRTNEVRHEVEVNGQYRDIRHSDLQDIIDEATAAWDKGEALIVAFDSAAEAAE